MKKEVQGGMLRRRLTARGAAVLVLMLAGPVHSETPVSVPDKSFPESVTSTRDGTLYVGSFNNGGITKIAPYDIGMDIQVGAQYKKFQFNINYARGYTKLYQTNYVKSGNSIWSFTLAYLIFGHDIKPKL